jgi:peptidoglycan/LPS O-acetylase OafA/YrhL
VAQRTKEIGVPDGVGARTPSTRFAESLEVASSSAFAGAALGLALAWSAADAVAGFLFEITPTDPATYVAVVVGVLALVCIAGLRAGTAGGHRGIRSRC